MLGLVERKQLVLEEKKKNTNSSSRRRKTEKSEKVKFDGLDELKREDSQKR